MFRGRFDHSIDAKGRLSIPAGFRVEIQRRNDRPPVLTNDKGCLALYPFDDWMEFEEMLKSADQFMPEVQALTRFFMSNAVDAPFDSQGRILIPKHLRRHASLEKEVTISGLSSRIEIWDTQALDMDLKQTTERLDEFRSKIARAAK